MARLPISSFTLAVNPCYHAAMPPDFDPFNDRLARDIRNGLAKALVAHLAELDLAPARQVAAEFATMALPPSHQAYIDDRLQRYESVVAAIRCHAFRKPFRQALVFWNQGLFFEFHEMVEELWHQSQAGEGKLALQAMIRAAGVYVHLAAGRPEVAASMAAKAATGLAAHGAALPLAIDHPALIAALERLDPVPPRLAGA